MFLTANAPCFPVDPSPARFARLVTQLKWRLLEGQGQAYYEIGVADSGLLIGLTKHDLEKSLETLEEMAGEIGELCRISITKPLKVILCIV
jgi:GTPase